MDAVSRTKIRRPRATAFGLSFPEEAEAAKLEDQARERRATSLNTPTRPIESYYPSAALGNASKRKREALDLDEESVSS